MRKAILHKSHFTVLFMLALSLLQSVFVTLEAAGMMHGSENSTYHHEALLTVDHSESDGSGDLVNASDVNAHQDADTCDHCCHCHGHGSHLSMLLKINKLMINLSSELPLSDERDFYSLHIHSIHRPPIA